MTRHKRHKKIDAFLDNLYSINEDFKNYENELAGLLNAFLDKQPDIELDEQFAEELHDDIKEAKYDFNKIARKLENSNTKPLSKMLNLTQKPLPVLAGIMLAFIIVISFIYYFFSEKDIVDKKENRINIYSVENNAFGDLNLNERLPYLSQSVLQDTPKNKDYYNFKYKGGSFVVDYNNIFVLKRMKNRDDTFNISAILDSKKLDLLNVEKFNGSNLDSFSLKENRDFGYILNVYTESGAVNILPNIERWKNNPALCETFECIESMRVGLSDIPSDDEVLDIADNFLDLYGINTEVYSGRSVDSSWRYFYESSENKDEFDFPDTILVSYPLFIEGKKVYNGELSEIGLKVGVDVRNKKVISVLSLTTNNYESSLYSAESNKDNILKMAESGGIRALPYIETEEDIELGTPTLSYFVFLKNNSGIQNEILVPALAFPIINPPINNPYLFNKKVIVPLIKF